MADRWANRIVDEGLEAPGQLLANPRNWRIHPKSQQQALGAMLDTVGWVQRVIVNRTTGHVVDGHLRVALAISREEPEVPVVYVELSEREEALVLAALDPLAGMAATDAEMLAELTSELAVDDAELAKLLGLGGTAGHTDPDEVPEPPGEPTTKPGDLWILDGHRLLCGDSTSSDAWSRLMGDARADCVFTDPPWNVDYRGGTKEREALANDHIEAGWDAWLTAALAAIPAKENAAAYVVFGLMRAGDTQQGIEAAGWRIAQTLVWVKQHAQFGNFRAHYKYQHEPIYYCSTGAKLPEWYGPNNEVSVWHHDRAAANEYHPTQKPVVLVEHALANSAPPGSIVVDAFGGSGSTLIAAHRMECVSYTMEIDPAYCDVIVKRWETFTGNEAKLDG